MRYKTPQEENSVCCGKAEEGKKESTHTIEDGAGEEGHDQGEHVLHAHHRGVANVPDNGPSHDIVHLRVERPGHTGDVRVFGPGGLGAARDPQAHIAPVG